jgi:hypothetical protein
LNRFVSFDVGVDSLGGTDYNGYERSELALSTGVILFANPDDVFHTYGVLGFNLSTAGVDTRAGSQRWSYIGAQGGLGLSVPMSSSFALGFEVIGFVRGRTDDRARTAPEFTDGAGRVTNTSGGGLLRAGVTVFW